MTQLDPAKKTVRQHLRRYQSLPHNSKWREIIDGAHKDYEQDDAGKAWIIREVYMAGRARHHRMSYAAMALQLHVSEDTVDAWLKEIVLEVALRAARARLI